MSEASPAAAGEPEPRELFVRSASRHGRPVVTMRACDLGDACVVEADVEGKTGEPKSYSFADAQQASIFVTEAVEALVYLGCEIRA
jgi:hypothetical protein